MSNDKKEIYARLAEMIDLATERVKICTPPSDYYSRRDEWCEDTIYVINASHLSSLLTDEAAKEE